MGKALAGFGAVQTQDRLLKRRSARLDIPVANEAWLLHRNKQDNLRFYTPYHASIAFSRGDDISKQLKFKENTARMAPGLARCACQSYGRENGISRSEDDMLGRFSRILVVDSCADSRKTTHGLLHRLGYENVDYAPDGGPALKLIGQNQYRLVLADWDAAPMNGLQLLKEMRLDQRQKRLPFIMAVARSQKKFVEIAREDGALHYLSKPFTVDRLAERIAQINSEAPKIRDFRPPSKPLMLGAPVPALVSPLWQSLRRAT